MRPLVSFNAEPSKSGMARKQTHQVPHCLVLSPFASLLVLGGLRTPWEPWVFLRQYAFLLEFFPRISLWSTDQGSDPERGTKNGTARAQEDPLAVCLWTVALPACSVKSRTNTVHQSWGVSYWPVPQALPSAFLPT